MSEVTIRAASPKRLNLAAIARAAGVSIPTVSRVVNGRPDVAPATRERIQQVIADQGYVVNRAARALRGGRIGLIDVLTQRLDTEYSLEMLRGIEDAVEDTEYRMVLAATYYESRRERQWLAKLLANPSDGVILILGDGQSRQLVELRSHGIPFVVVDHRGELEADTPAVGATNWLGGRTATEHLLQLGHRRIGYIGGPPTYGCEQARQAGYRAALQAAGIPAEPCLMRSTTFRADGGYQQARALLDLADPPTAIFAANDLQATGVYRALRERDIAIPGGMSVVGFDDVPLASLLSPPLTTVRQPLPEMGRAAVNMLVRLIDGETLRPPRVELATSLVLRGSCAPFAV
ncbi:MAG: LacI family DNA-binding transcriptional regulator [Chloroflexi bacterium]|nr:LacI family DNA-binding transcriptional regulator [Chloroflexota bacterium]